MIDWQKTFDQPGKNGLRVYDDVQKVVICPGDDYATGCLLDYSYFKENYKLNAIYLSKQQALYGDAKATQQILLEI